MSKTLEDMTPDEREDCKGMWCDVPGIPPTILVYIVPERNAAACVIPTSGEIFDHKLSKVTPRFDLSRAWTRRGEPLED